MALNCASKLKAFSVLVMFSKELLMNACRSTTQQRVAKATGFQQQLQSGELLQTALLHSDSQVG